MNIKNVTIPSKRPDIAQTCPFSGRNVHPPERQTSRQARAELSLELQRLALIETLALRAGLIHEATRGRKPGWRKS